MREIERGGMKEGGRMRKVRVEVGRRESEGRWGWEEVEKAMERESLKS